MDKLTVAASVLTIFMLCSATAFQSRKSTHLGKLRAVEHVSFQPWLIQMDAENDRLYRAQCGNPFLSSSSKYLGRLQTLRSTNTNADSDRQNPIESNDSSDDRAAAFTEYLARAHEDKLRAIAEIERSRKEEIHALKEEIALLKSRESDSSRIQAKTVYSNSVSGTGFSGMSKEQLIEVTQQYHNFISKYVVDASLEKYRAVQAAEAALNQKWESRLNAMTSETPPTPPVDLSVSLKVETIDNGFGGTKNELYDTRTEAVLASAKNGNSRWGNKEIQRIIGSHKIAPNNAAITPTSLDSSISSFPIESGRNVDELETRLNGITSPEVALISVNGASGSLPDGSSEPISAKTLYELRQAAIIAADSAGKSRWGGAEIDKVRSSHETFPETRHIGHISPILSGEGSVTQKVAIAPVKEMMPSPPVSSDASHIVALRNEAVIAASLVGKSRWGSEEIDRISSRVPHIVVNGVRAVHAHKNEVPISHEYKDANRGAAGPTLSERVVFGATYGFGATNGMIDSSASANSVRVPAVKATDTALFTLRNSAVVDSFSTGTSRWSKPEVDKAREALTNVVVNGDNSLIHSNLAPLGSASELNLFNLRSSAVIDSFAAGKSRWSKSEVEKAKESLSHVAVNGDVSLIHSGPVALGSASEANLFQLRNIAVLESDAAGKSRWSRDEVEKTRMSTTNESRHADRLPIQPKVVPGVISSERDLFTLRNAAVIAAEAAGQLRWGKAEIEKARLFITTALNGYASQVQLHTKVPIPASVLAADHGLRSDGAVGGPTLAERVAYGAMAGAALASILGLQ